jgi:hypothetical protein
VVSLIVIAGLIAKKFRWREIHPYIFILNLLILLLQFY